MKHKKSITMIAFALVIAAAFIFTSCPGPAGPAGADGKDGEDGDGFELAPDCSHGNIEVNIAALGTNIRGVDSAPSVTALLSVKDSDGNYINNLVEADFFDTADEDGNAYNLQVQWIEGVGIVPKADVIFVLDTTGSMLDEIDYLLAEIQGFADILAASGVDFRLGMTTFGDEMGNTVDPFYLTNRAYFAPTSNVTAFKAFVAGLTAYGGADGPENQVDALDYTRAASTEVGSNPEGSYQVQAGFNYRSGAKKVFILVTDADFHTPATPGNVLNYYPGVYNTLGDEIAKLNGNNVTVHVVGPDIAGYHDLANGTGGMWFDIYGDFTDIIEAIGVALTNNYVITYKTDDWTKGTWRDVRIAVHAKNLGVDDCGEDEASYRFPSYLPFSAIFDRIVVEPVAEPNPPSPAN